MIIVNMVREWSKKLHLKFEEIFKENNVYFLQIRKIRGEKSAEDCEGLLTTKDIRDYASVWRFDSVRVKTISSRDYLRLFELEHDEILFPSANSDDVYKTTGKRFDIKKVKMLDYINENLTVTIGSKNGYNLEITLPISDILSHKKPNNKRFFNKLKDFFS